MKCYYCGSQRGGCVECTRDVLVPAGHKYVEGSDDAAEKLTVTSSVPLQLPTFRSEECPTHGTYLTADAAGCPSCLVRGVDPASTVNLASKTIALSNPVDPLRNWAWYRAYGSRPMPVSLGEEVKISAFTMWEELTNWPLPIATDIEE